VTFDWLQLFILHKHGEISLLPSIVCKSWYFFKRLDSPIVPSD